ncbi:hypothetical protein N9Q18_00330 [bacterium]|nr:hypothetical protein [bacterium]
MFDHRVDNGPGAGGQRCRVAQPGAAEADDRCVVAGDGAKH